jgi:hypothetical protein
MLLPYRYRYRYQSGGDRWVAEGRSNAGQTDACGREIPVAWQQGKEKGPDLYRPDPCDYTLLGATSWRLSGLLFSRSAWALPLLA